MLITKQIQHTPEYFFSLLLYCNNYLMFYFFFIQILIVVILTALQKKRSNIHFHHLPLVGLCTIVVIFGHVTICTGQTNNMDLICQKNPQSVLLQACLLACFFFLAICVADLILMSSFDSIKKVIWNFLYESGK